MSNIFLYTFSSASFIVFLFVSYFSNAWAKVRKNNDDSPFELKAKETIKLTFTYGKTNFKNLQFSSWLTIILSAVAATIAIVAVQLLNMHILFVVKIFVSLIALHAAAIIDLNTHTIPNLLSLYLIFARVLFIPFEFIYQKEVITTLLLSSAIGGIATFLVLYLIHRITKSGFGMGDVKLLSALGIMVGISSCLTTILFGMIIAALLGIGMILLKRKTRKDSIPFGPFILIGFIISVILGVF